MENMKRSTSRDFRINTASLEAALHELSEEDDVEEENETTGQEENQSTHVNIFCITCDSLKSTILIKWDIQYVVGFFCLFLRKAEVNIKATRRIRYLY